MSRPSSTATVAGTAPSARTVASTSRASLEVARTRHTMGDDRAFKRDDRAAGVQRRGDLGGDVGMSSQRCLPGNVKLAAAPSARSSAAARPRPARSAAMCAAMKVSPAPGDAGDHHRGRGGDDDRLRRRGAGGPRPVGHDNAPRAARDQPQRGLFGDAKAAPSGSGRLAAVDVERRAPWDRKGRSRSALPGEAGATRRSAAAKAGSVAMRSSSASVRLPSSAAMPRPGRLGAPERDRREAGAGSCRPRPPANARRRWRQRGRSRPRSPCSDRWADRRSGRHARLEAERAQAAAISASPSASRPTALSSAGRSPSRPASPRC